MTQPIHRKHWKLKFLGLKVECQRATIESSQDRPEKRERTPKPRIGTYCLKINTLLTEPSLTRAQHSVPHYTTYTKAFYKLELEDE